MDEHVRKEYLKKMRKEVDFHHKVAFRFEKAYRLSKKHPEKEEALNKEIVLIISEHGSYLKYDPMALFYSLFFCIYFKNQKLIEFLSHLCLKIMTMGAD